MDLSERLDRYLATPPKIHPDAFVHPAATVVGDVTLGPRSSVWPGAVLRGDINSIIIGEGSNVQDGSIVHLADDFGVSVGDYVTIGHLAMIHACAIGNRCLIGMHSTILDGSKIGEECIIGANSLVTGGTEIPDGSLAFGNPAKVRRALSPHERSDLRKWAEKYIEVASAHRRRLAK